YTPSRGMLEHLRLRNSICAVPGCTRGSSWASEADHIEEDDHGAPERGGLTEIEDLHLLCWQHHRATTAGPLDAPRLPRRPRPAGRGGHPGRPGTGRTCSSTTTPTSPAPPRPRSCWTPGPATRHGPRPGVAPSSVGRTHRPRRSEGRRRVGRGN